MRNHFLRLMERFDLSYRTLENRDISLVVECLPFEPPDYESLWQAIKQTGNCKEISMKFQVSEILPGIPTWFIARQHRFTTNNHWRTGVLFAYGPDCKHLGLVKTVRDERTNADYLQLTVRGSMPHSFFDLLKEGIELTLRRYPGLQITRLLPCPDPNGEGCTHEFDYANLSKRLERQPPKEFIECPNCLENISVTKLLFGLHWTTQDAVLSRIDKLENNLEDKIQDGFEELRELVQNNFTRQFRQEQKYLESYCPNVFVLRPDQRKFWHKDLDSRRIYLQLYCQKPGCWHPTDEGGVYPIDEPRQWLRVTAPYIRGLVKVLKYTTPIVGSWVGIAASDYEELINTDLTLMNDLATKLDDEIKDLPEWDSAEGIPERENPQRVIGAALRALRQLLEKEDSQHHWGGLQRVLTPEGDYLWLCKHHAGEYTQ